MSQEYAAHVSLPLFASLGVVAFVTGAVLLWGAHLTHRQDPSQGSSFLAREPLGSVHWSVWLLIVTGVFLAANQMLVRGVAVGTWDVDGQFYPYYVLVADHARAGRLVQWHPW